MQYADEEGVERRSTQKLLTGKRLSLLMLCKKFPMGCKPTANREIPDHAVLQEEKTREEHEASLSPLCKGWVNRV